MIGDKMDYEMRRILKETVELNTKRMLVNDPDYEWRVRNAMEICSQLFKDQKIFVVSRDSRMTNSFAASVRLPRSKVIHVSGREYSLGLGGITIVFLGDRLNRREVSERQEILDYLKISSVIFKNKYDIWNIGDFR